MTAKETLEQICLIVQEECKEHWLLSEQEAEKIVYKIDDVNNAYIGT